MDQHLIQYIEFHSIARQESIKREFEQMKLERLVRGNNRGKRISVRRLLAAAGLRLVNLGTQLVERYGATGCECGQEQPGAHIAGLV